ncbi:XI-2 [Symbiodinium natans]|uniref:XI-2 protein n=1 Tax=Symbiodinium natans TaxID=878477 RepID=A0A812JYW4_9DINO|nr:XI-2 [Symbiodinium natans]
MQIQRCWRGYMGRLRWETEYERLWSRETAALIIQRNVRGWLARSAVTGRRKRKARAEFERARRRFKAAQKIQALTRGVLCRKRVKAFWRRKVEAATTIQRIWRGHRLRCQRRDQDRRQQLVKIQSMCRTFLVRSRRFHLLARVILVQRHWRKWLRYIPEAERARRRERSLQQRKAATIIQQGFRDSQSYAKDAAAGPSEAPPVPEGAEE